MVAAEASGALRPSAAMAMPQSLRMSGKFPGVIVFLEMGVVFMFLLLVFSGDRGGKVVRVTTYL
jgi:hypothetical protein